MFHCSFVLLDIFCEIIAYFLLFPLSDCKFFALYKGLSSDRKRVSVIMTDFVKLSPALLL